MIAKNRLYFFVVTLLLTAAVHAQDAVPEGRFLQETVKVGEPLRYSLHYAHNPKMRLLFPDSAYVEKETDFECMRRQYFPTRTLGAESVDSVVYTLRTFELDSTQQLRLPVFLMTAQGDTQKIYARPARIQLRYALTSIDTLQRAAQGNTAQFLKTDTRFQKVAREFNYPYFLTGLFVFVLVFVLVAVLFGRRIRRYFRQRRLKKQHKTFLSDYNRLLAQGVDSKTAEKALTHWKNYLERLQKKPYSSYTAREIARLHPEAGLQEPLKQVDRAVYGGRTGEATASALETLRAYAQTAYQERIARLQNPDSEETKGKYGQRAKPKQYA